jgi:hypothetical protein
MHLFTPAEFDDRGPQFGSDNRSILKKRILKSARRFSFP